MVPSQKSCLGTLATLAPPYRQPDNALPRFADVRLMLCRFAEYRLIPTTRSTAHSCFNRTYTIMINQVIRNRYIKEMRLKELLERIFPSNFWVEVSFLSANLINSDAVHFLFD